MNIKKIGMTGFAFVSIATIMLATDLEVKAASVTGDSKADITFKLGQNDPIDPLDPINPDPDEPITPDPDDEDGFPVTGPLSIDYVSNIHFGDAKISGSAAVYNAKMDNVNFSGTKKDVPNFVQVSDNRGSNEGWRLTVKQNGQFKADNVEKTELTGAELSLKELQATSLSGNQAPTLVANTVLNPNGGVSVVATAAKDKGMGTWSLSYGDGTGTYDSIQLAVPSSTKKLEKAYKTTLTWELAEVPA
ncbi:WxL domain-containing protein [Listeria ivanovii]|uniref:WxL domain-containing protein n=1 Tax=Listeria ivanovii (strain ATCC BAA-678 / PAM 55) TaxID=881621 RepID=G2ZDK0_LISIP|nr:WxL domain-containing protein [Listeria ivanovii]AHI56615.1 cell surface protein [Listeria ivanovii WSLC3009]AIS66033.1 hypothetical protein JL52_10955 [Listeria ivanovii subsp. ivanovii]MBC1758925.1 WxL domain-containing protein [Listeria ivanovii]MBK3913948.1 WxL domain-containing protein [Listeria ivanovii subsp. ivanovii]MBK3921214.1 WxL domain-containing protein [Listeria ivanovii subsp. ivanovii]